MQYALLAKYNSVLGGCPSPCTCYQVDRILVSAQLDLQQTEKFVFVADHAVEPLFRHMDVLQPMASHQNANCFSRKMQGHSAAG